MIAILATVVLGRMAGGGFAESNDFSLAFAARLLGDLGLARADMAGALGQTELFTSLTQVAPVVLLEHALFFRLFGNSPVVHLVINLVLHLAIVAAVIFLALLWQPRRRPAWLAGLIVALHPIAAGALGGLTSLSVLTAMLCLLAAMLFTLATLRLALRTLALPVMPLALLAALCDRAGLLVFPAVLLTVLTAPRRSRWEQIHHRLLPPLAALAGMAVMMLTMRRLSGPGLYFDPAGDWQAIAWPQHPAWLLRALLWPIDPTLRTGPYWLAPAVIALLTALLVSRTVAAARRRPGVTIWPTLCLLSLLPAAPALRFPYPPASPTVWAAFYPALIFFSLWVFDLRPRPADRASGGLAILLLIGVLLCQTFMAADWRADHARFLNTMGREMAGLVKDFPEGVDVFLCVPSREADQAEIAFLAGHYRGMPSQQIRYRFLLDGALKLLPQTAPIGRDAYRWTRLPLDENTRFLGLNDSRRHWVDLTGLIRAKLRQADAVLREQHRIWPELPIGDERTIGFWLAGCTVANDLPPDRARWFLEGFLLPLHPRTGRSIMPEKE